MPEEILKWANDEAHVQSSENMDYNDIFAFIEEHVKEGIFVRLHTGDPSIYSTIARQIDFLKSKAIDYEVIPGVTAAFAGAASQGIEYTIPGISQTLILSRIAGKTPNPESLINLLNCKNSSLVFYLSVTLLKKLKELAINEAGYSKNTPCWVIEKASWPEEQVVKGTLETIAKKVQRVNIRGNALILLGDFLYQKETESSHLYRIKQK